MRRRAVLALLAAAVAACSGGHDSTLGRAERAMARLDAASLSVELTASTAGVADLASFRIDGKFAARGDGDLPRFTFDFVESLGGRETLASVRSDGETVLVEVDGAARELSAEESRALRLDGGEGFADLGIASWVEHPEEHERGGGIVVGGDVDAADLIADISRLARQVAGGAVAVVEGDDAERLSRLVERSEIEVVIDGDGIPRSVDATLGFGAGVPDELADALGPYAGSTLRLIVELEPLDADQALAAARNAS